MPPKILPVTKSAHFHTKDPLECPFREFRDNELHLDGWGLGTAAFRAYSQTVSTKTATKEAGQRSGASPQSPKAAATASGLWIDDQTQPVPRSVRQYLHGWIRAEELALARWGAEVTIYEENDSGKMAIADMQLCHAQVLLRSSFCRKVLSACFVLERVELAVEHQWELFTCVLAPEGWRAKYHIYSPGLKPGGGPQHKPILSKNGCYLIRLFYLGSWRCVWVNDQVPVDTSGAPLLPFSPLLTHPPAKPGSTRIPPAVTAGVIYLWPLLMTKALLKLAAPDMNSDEDSEDVEDEPLEEFDILHALTGSMTICYPAPEIPTHDLTTPDSDEIWARIIAEVPVFTWDDEEDASTIKTKSTKKPTAKELAAVVKQHTTMTCAILKDSKDYQPFHLPGITPGHRMTLLITMARDLPLKKPLPEPEVALWKYYRWVDWARAHGLYTAYDCPRDKYLKVNGLLKSSYAPHLLDVQSTESITMGFIEEHVKSTQNDKDDDEVPKKKKKEVTKSQIQQALVNTQQQKAELREWIKYAAFFTLLDCLQVVYHPSLFNFTSAGSNPPIRMTKSANTKMVDIVAPKFGPLYMQLDGPEINKLRISFSTLHSRVLFNSGSPIDEYIEPGHLVLERFEWFSDTATPVQKAFLTTTGYDSLEVDFEPGRHFFRIWTHYRINWHMMLISESSLLLGTRDLILGAAVHECSWSSRFLLNLGTAFSNWIKISRASGQPTILTDREFFRSYLPDLPWDDKVIGYDRHLLHWMFRQALQSLLSKTLGPTEWKTVAYVLRKYFCDPDFGFPDKPLPPRSLREIANLDVCDCLMPEIEEIEFMEEQEPEVTEDQEVTFPGEPEEQEPDEEKPLVASRVMDKLLQVPEPPVVSNICEMATDELYCAILKEEREKMIKKHEAAIVLQAHWRGTWARKVLSANIVITPDVTKHVMERAFGTLEALSMLMNEFFLVWPSTKPAYSVASALSGVYGLQQHAGTTAVTSKCKWVPHFQGVFYCHAPVKVHFDIQSSVSHSTVEVYNNDSGEQLPQVYNSHVTFNFAPNKHGYTVLGHGTLAQVPGIHYDAHWQLTIMSCLNGAFHLCDNEEICKELPLPHSYKLHLHEIFLPNRRNILGGIQISVTHHQAVSFRAAASSCDLEMVATLRSTVPGSQGGIEDLATCSGKGEIYWPYIRLEPIISTVKKSQQNMSSRDIALPSTRSLLRTPRGPKANKPRSNSKLRLAVIEPRVYSIEVTCPMGWPLTLEQWKRVAEVRNTIETLQIMHQSAPKKVAIKEKEKPGKPLPMPVKEKVVTLLPVQQPLPGDACVELECALAVGGGAIARRDDDRDVKFAAARKSWAAVEPGRNQKGAQIRKEFRSEFLVMPPLQTGLSPSATDTTPTGSIGMPFEETVLLEDAEAEATQVPDVQRPTPVSETDMVEMTMEYEEEAYYLLMPDQLRDKFIPLNFLAFCVKEKNEEESVLVSADMAEAAKKDRHARIEAALERMRELQLFNEEHVIGRQKTRCKMLEKLFVDATMQPELIEVMEEKEEAIAQEINLTTVPVIKKKVDTKKK